MPDEPDDAREPSVDVDTEEGAEAAGLAAPLDEAPPLPADDPELGGDGVGAGDLP